MKTRLNLIPEYKKEEIEQKIILVKVLRWGFELTSIFALFIALLFSLGYITKLNLMTNTIKLSSNNISQFKTFEEYDAEIKGMNAKTVEIQKIQNGQMYWSKFFAKLQELVPDGIIINNLATKDYAVALAGTADKRDNLITFKEKIATDECFTDVNLPLSDLVAEENSAFQIDFNIKKECLAQINGQ